MKTLRLWLTNRKRLHSKPHTVASFNRQTFDFHSVKYFRGLLLLETCVGGRWCQRGDTGLLRWLVASPTDRPQKPPTSQLTSASGNVPADVHGSYCCLPLVSATRTVPAWTGCTFCDVSHIEPRGVWDECDLKGGGRGEARIANSCCHTQPSSWNSRPRAGLRARALRQICCYLELSKKGNENDTSLIRCHLLTVTDDNHGQPPLARGWWKRLTFVSGASSSSPADVWSLCSPWASDIE